MEEEKTPGEAPKKGMNTMMIVGIVVVVLIIGGGFLLFGSKNATAPTATPTSTTVAQVETTSPTAVAIQAATDKVSIETKNFAFSPKTIKVKAGGTITFTNRDTVSHSFTADDGKSFDSGLNAKDQTKTIKAPTKPGEYPFHCTPHPSMKGTLIVE